MNRLTPAQIGMLAATAAGAVSVFPDMPYVVRDLFDSSRNEYADLMKYGALYVLLLQGGAGFEPDVALAGTAGFYAAVQLANMLFPMGLSSKYPSMMEMPPSVEEEE